MEWCYHRPVTFTEDVLSNLLFSLSFTTTFQGKFLLSFYRRRDWSLERNDLLNVGGHTKDVAAG